MKDDASETLKGCGWALLLLLVSPLTVSWNGYVGSVLWRWFIAPAFGLPPISVPVAIGISLLLAHLTPRRDCNCKSDKTAASKFGENLANIILNPALALLVGWIVLKFA